jgi:hypothetical protein
MNMRRKIVCLWLLLAVCCVRPTAAHGAHSARATLRVQHATAPRNRPLWPGARFTEADRVRAIRRGLDFIYRTARDRTNFATYGGDYVWCFYTLSSASADESISRAARRMGLERARLWRAQHRTLPRSRTVHGARVSLI